jgi:predicted tellurium resistance membrane protein TerC
MVTRIALLLAISWVMRLTDTLFTVFAQEISGRDLILIVGGLFLIGKSVHEIYEKVEVHEEEVVSGWSKSLAGVVAQIMVLDIVFSLDSVITAVGMVDEVEVMIVAIVIAVLIMLVFARPVGDFVNRHPSMKILALSFLMLIGVVLVADGLDQHIPKGYIYFAMGFGLSMELLNMRLRRKSRKKIEALEEPIVPEDLDD